MSHGENYVEEILIEFGVMNRNLRRNDNKGYFYIAFLTALMTYFWTVVQNLYKKLGETNSDKES